MTPTTSAPPPAAPATTPERHERSGTTAAVELSLPRLHLLRFGYLLMAVGLTVVQWPSIINGDVRGPGPLTDGVVTCMLVALSLLCFLGLRYPVQMLPVLLFESAWKLLWLTIVALPLWRADRMDPAAVELTIACLWVVIILAVIPWRFVIKHYMRKPGDRWAALGDTARARRLPPRGLVPQERWQLHLQHSSSPSLVRAGAATDP